MNHLSALILFSVFVSLTFALIAKDDPKERIKYFLLSLAAFVISSIIAAWIMYPFPL